MAEKRKALTILVFLALAAPFSAYSPGSEPIQGAVALTIHGQEQPLSNWENEYLFHSLEQIDRVCPGSHSNESVADIKASSAQIYTQLKDGSAIYLRLLPDANTSGPHVEILKVSRGVTTRIERCDKAMTMPVAAILESKNLLASASASDGIAESGRQNIYPKSSLSAYEKNSLGWERDDDSVNSGYMDANISFKYRAYETGSDNRYAFYLAFTTRFSQYLETISSSPVVGKRYNPSAFMRTQLIDKPGYIDIGYAHESNGQSINTQEAFEAEQAKYAQSDGDADFARNFISRGWDYAFFDWRNCWRHCSESNVFSGSGGIVTEVSFKYFLDDGFLQGKPEEYNVWEGGKERRRKEYDGVSFLGDYRWTNCLGVDDFGCNISWQYTTGYENVFDHSTNRIQFAIDSIRPLPSIGFWVQSGRNSSLVNYYENVTSVGIALLFNDPFEFR